MPRNEPDPLTIATHMREAVGYLAVLASKSELDKIAQKLLGVHVALGTKIDALIEERNEDRVRAAREQKSLPVNKSLRC